MGEIIAIIVLGAVVVAQAIDKYFYTKKMHQQVDDALKAALSRNVSEYLSAKADDKPKKETPLSEFIPLEEADDETFNQALGIAEKSNEPAK